MFHEIPMQVPVNIFVTIDNFILKFILKCMGPWLATKTLKKKSERNYFLYINPSSPCTIIKTGRRIDRHMDQ